MEITVSGDDKKLIKQVENLAIKLGLKISRKVTPDVNRTINTGTLMELMQEMAASGGITSIPDPLQWQKELRKDQSLSGREE